MLYLFDLDDTLISSYMRAANRNYNIWELLPGRYDAIQRLYAQGHSVGIVTNQAGVAMGHITEFDVRYKLHQVAIALDLAGVRIFDGGVAHQTSAGVLPVWVCYDHPRAWDSRYRVNAGRRKPSGAMIHEAIAYGFERDLVLFVGDHETDEAAAKAAGVRFQWAHIFFKDGAP